MHTCAHQRPRGRAEEATGICARWQVDTSASVAMPPVKRATLRLCFGRALRRAATPARPPRGRVPNLPSINQRPGSDQRKIHKHSKHTHTPDARRVSCTRDARNMTRHISARRDSLCDVCARDATSTFEPPQCGDPHAKKNKMATPRRAARHSHLPCRPTARPPNTMDQSRIGRPARPTGDVEGLWTTLAGA